MKKTLLIITTIVTAIAITAIITISQQLKVDERTAYEQFLVKEYSNLPIPTDEDLEGVPGAHHPDLAAIQDYFETLDPELGRVPTERKKDAIQATMDARSAKYLKSSGRDINWQGTEVVMGGRTRAVMWDPNDANGSKVWAGGVTGGLWYNNNIHDEDSEWFPVDDFWSTLSISCITYDPTNPNRFYVGTGEVQTAFTTYRESSGVGMGIYYTANGGNNWFHMPSTIDFKYVTEIAVRDENGVGVIYAGVASGFYHGQDQQSIPTDGLYRSSDYGATWTQVLPNIAGDTVPYAVSNVKVGADGRLYVGSIHNLNHNGGATILLSDDGTEGSWTVFDDYEEIIQNNGSYYLPGRVIIACAPSDPNIVYACLAAGYTNFFNYYQGRYILKSTDRGETWDQITKPNSGDWANLAWHAMIASVDPNDPDALFAGGLDVWKTEDSGDDWNHVSDWALMYYGGGDDYVHADQHAQVYKPGSSDTMVFGTDGGIFYTKNATASYPVFEQHNKNYNTLQFYTCDIHPQAGMAKYVGGLQDNGTLYYTGTPIGINDMVDGGDGAYCFIDKNEGDIMITSVYYNRYTVFWEEQEYNYINDYQSGVFINPADYDYNENVIYANATSFSGQQINKILRITNILGNESGTYQWLQTGSLTYFSHVKYSPYSPAGTATLFLGTNAGRVYRVENAEGNSPQVTEITGLNFPLGSVSCIAIGGSEDTLMVTFSNYGVTSIYQSFNGGGSWAQKEGNLPDMPVRWAIYHPNGANQALIATETGIWESYNLTTHPAYWYPVTDGLANVRVDMLKIRESDNTVLAATHGRGLFTTEWDYIPSTGIEEENTASMNVWPNPVSDIVNISLTNHLENGTVDIMDMQGRIVFSDQLSVISSSTHLQSKSARSDSRIELNISGLVPGNYLMVVKENGTVVAKEKILKN